MKSLGFVVPSAILDASPAATVAYLKLLGGSGHYEASESWLAIMLGITYPDESSPLVNELEQLGLVECTIDAERRRHLRVVMGGTLNLDGMAFPSKKKKKKKGSRDLEGEYEGKPLPLFDQVVDLYHAMLPDLPRVAVRAAHRRTAFSNRAEKPVVLPNGKTLDPSTLTFWTNFFETVSRSDFLMGRAKSWHADFDFLISPRGFTGVIEGKYENRT